MRKGFLLIVCFVALTGASAASELEFLSFEELNTLAKPSEPEFEQTTERLNRLLTIPRVVSTNSSIDSTSNIIRIAFWNIGWGLQWPMIEAALRDPDEFKSRIAQHRGFSALRWQRAAEELSLLRTADVILLNEVDVGMPRTAYADVVRELANALGMNYTFAVEFVELSGLADDVDPLRYRGLHGNAILSRFPIRSVTVHRLPQCYDWFETERMQITNLEKGKRWTAARLLNERVARQVRRGGRMALIAELNIGLGADETLTAVASHLEERSTPSCRQQQMLDLLTAIQGIAGPVVLGADLNSSGRDGTPTSFEREITRRLTSRQFWGRCAIQWFVPPFSWMLHTMNLWKNSRDPTAVSIPILARNRERSVFEMLRKFRFFDGGAFDFGQEATLDTTNARGRKGFRPTRRLDRNLLGFMGGYKLDWIFVKPGYDRAGNADMQPENPRTLTTINRLPRVPLSDHSPITVDLRRSRLDSDQTSTVDSGLDAQPSLGLNATRSARRVPVMESH